MEKVIRSDRKKNFGLAAVLAASFLYGCLTLASKWVLSQGVTQEQLLALRFAIGSCAAFILCRACRLDMRITGKQAAMMALIGSCGFGATSLLLIRSMLYIDAGLSSMLHFSYPAVTALIMRLLFHEKTSRRRWMAVAISLCGVFVMGMDSLKMGLSATGLLLAVSSGVAYAAFIVGVNRSCLQTVHPVVLGFYVSLCNAVIFAVMMFAGGAWKMPVTGGVLASVSMQAVLFTTLPMCLLAYGVSCIGSTKAAVLNTFEPIVSLLGGAILFHEKLTPLCLFGCIMILASIALIGSDK